jgi:hypothetical protein
MTGSVPRSRFSRTVRTNSARLPNFLEAFEQGKRPLGPAAALARRLAVVRNRLSSQDAADSDHAACALDRRGRSLGRILGTRDLVQLGGELAGRAARRAGPTGASGRAYR